MINWEQELIQLAGAARAKESMRMHTTFQVGGPADYFIEVDSAEKISSVRKLCREQGVPCYVIGKGSNLLVGDNGIRGVVLHIGDGMSDCRVLKSNCCYNMEAEAGLWQLSQEPPAQPVCRDWNSRPESLALWAERSI